MSQTRTIHLIFLWLFGAYVIPVDLLMVFAGIPFSPGWWDATFYFTFYALLTLFIYLTFLARPPNWQRFIGPRPTRSAVREAFAFFIFLWVASVAIGYLTFFPLSFLYPDFVSDWYLPYSPAVYTEGASILWGQTFASLISLVVLAPVLEEVLFRGIVLRSFTHKFGLLKSVLFSSILFGVVHPDSFAATMFGIAMCVLYLRHRSLVLVIGVHAVWNCSYFIIEFLLTLLFEEEQHYTLQEFQSDWPWGLMFLLISSVWIAILATRPGTERAWHLDSA